jgi:hypothetical protein
VQPSRLTLACAMESAQRRIVSSSSAGGLCNNRARWQSVHRQRFNDSEYES